MFCSFTETPKVLRLYGAGRVVRPGDPGWAELARHFPALAGADGARSGADGAGAEADEARAEANGAGAEADGAEAEADGAGAGADGARAGADGRAAAVAGSGAHRAIIVAELDRIADSCGYGVPVMDPREERDLLMRWAERKTPEQLAAYRAEKNEVSIDRLPALG